MLGANGIRRGSQRRCVTTTSPSVAWVSQNWRGQPSKGYAVILKLIAATRTEAGLTVQCQLDANPYPAGRKVSDEEMATLSLLPDAFHGEWNYTILSRATHVDTIIL